MDDRDGTQSASSWEDEEPRSSIEMEMAYNTPVGDSSDMSASELLSQGKLACLPPVPAPETEPLNIAGQPQVSGAGTIGTSSTLGPVIPPKSPKTHPLGVQKTQQ